MLCNICKQPLEPWEVTICEPCGEILQDSSIAALTQTEKQRTFHPPAARCSRQTIKQGAKTMSTQKVTVAVTNKDFGYAVKFLKNAATRSTQAKKLGQGLVTSRF